MGKYIASPEEFLTLLNTLKDHPEFTVLKLNLWSDEFMMYLPLATEDFVYLLKRTACRFSEIHYDYDPETHSWINLWIDKIVMQQ